MQQLGAAQLLEMAKCFCAEVLQETVDFSLIFTSIVQPVTSGSD